MPSSPSAPSGIRPLGYNTLNRLTNLSTVLGAAPIQSYAFTLGPSGNRTQIVEMDKTKVYTYDDLYRLTGEQVIGGTAYTKTFGYDPVGNRQTQTTAGSAGSVVMPGVVNYGYDTRDRLLTENATTYGYDANGNLTTQSGFGTYTFDTENRLVRIAKLDGTLIEHAYDADGVRIRTKTTLPASATQTTNFLVHTSRGLSHVVAESSAAGAQTAYYLRALDDLLAVIRPVGTRYYHADGIGSVRKLTDETGTVTDSYEYTAFGEQYEHVGTDPQPYSFAGEPLEPNTGFQYHRARWMQPSTGRFAGMDPFKGVTFDPTSLHRYLYAGNDPGNMLDPSGLMTLSTLGTAISSMLTIAAINVPRIASFIATVAQILAPAELGVLPQQLGIWQLRGVIAGSGPVIILELGNIRRAWLALGARATGPIGIAFEKWIGRLIGIGARAQVAVRDGVELASGPGSGSRAGAAILDYVDDAAGVIYEVKASFSAVKYNQAAQAAQYAARSGKRVVYIFLRKPNQSQLNELAEWIGDGARAVGGSAQFGVSAVF